MTLQHFDFRLVPCGRDVLLRPLTSQAYLWLADNLPPGERRLPASQALIPQERIKATLTAILSDGLSIAPLNRNEYMNRELRTAIYLTDDATEIQIALFYLWNQWRLL